MPSVIEARGLTKTFCDRAFTVEAVCGIDLDVCEGQIFGFLGPNGAGKSTTLRMLVTLLAADSGEATIAGFDLHREAQKVRQNIGYVSQSGGSETLSTGRESLLRQGALYGLSSTEAKARVQELMTTFEIGDFADRKVSTYSGGQRRRLEIAVGLMSRPKVLFLDEPTTGLDPQNRSNLWGLLRGLREQETAVFLTTHYLEEADLLADHLAIMDFGRIVAQGTPDELKQEISGDTISLRLKKPEKLPLLVTAVERSNVVRESRIEANELQLRVANGPQSLARIFEILSAENIELETVALANPSLDDVFLAKTGRTLRDAQPEET